MVGTVFAFGQGASNQQIQQPGATHSRGQSKQETPGVRGEQHKAPSTSGQAQRNEENRAQGPVQQEENRPQGQVPQKERRTQGQAQQPQNRTQGQTQREPAQTQREGGGSPTLTGDQRTKVRQTVIQGRNAPRVDRLNFSLNVGTPVPRRVRVLEVPPTLVEIHPEWRGYRYFVYQDEIVIVDPRSLMIVAVVNV